MISGLYITLVIEAFQTDVCILLWILEAGTRGGKRQCVAQCHPTRSLVVRGPLSKWVPLPTASSPHLCGCWDVSCNWILHPWGGVNLN